MRYRNADDTNFPSDFFATNTGSVVSVRPPPVGDWREGAVAFRVEPSGPAAASPPRAAEGDVGAVFPLEHAVATAKSAARPAAVKRCFIQSSEYSRSPNGARPSDGPGSCRSGIWCQRNLRGDNRLRAPRPSVKTIGVLTLRPPRDAAINDFRTAKHETSECEIPHGGCRSCSG